LWGTKNQTDVHNFLDQAVKADQENRICYASFRLLRNYNTLAENIIILTESLLRIEGDLKNSIKYKYS